MKKHLRKREGDGVIIGCLYERSDRRPSNFSGESDLMRCKGGIIDGM